jgi:hypothetical protein
MLQYICTHTHIYIIGGITRIAMDYRLHGRDSNLGRVKVFSLHHKLKAGSGAHAASYTMGTGGDFPRDKAAEA